MGVSILGASAGGLQQYEQLFASSGIWTRPAGVKTCEVTILGGSNYSTTNVSSAGGYFKGIVNVDGLSTVTITVGAGGTASVQSAGSSSFGTLAAAPGNGAGANYRPQSPGFVPGSVSVAVGPAGNNLGWYSGIYMNSSYCHTANNRLFIYSNQNPGGYATSTDGITWTSSNAGWANTTKFVFGNNSYVFFSLNNYIGTVTQSTDGANWTNRSLAVGGVITDMAYGPAGFIAFTGNPTSKSTDGVTWTSITPSGLPSNTYHAQGTSSYYYAFPTAGNTTTAYRSTDGITWTSFSLNANLSGSQSAKSFVSFNNKVYVLNGSGTLQIIDGTTVTSAQMAVSVQDFYMQGSIYIYGATSTFYSAISPSTPVTTDNFGIPNIGSSNNAIVTNTGLAYGTSSNNTNSNFYYSNGYAGQAGFPTNNLGTNAGSPGVLSPGLDVPNLTYGYPTPGQGNEDGWGYGASNYRWRSTYGSGSKINTPGNAGVVRVRWWA